MGLIRQSESGAHVAKTARFGVRSTRPVVVTVIHEPRAGRVLRCRLAPCTNSPGVARVEMQRSVSSVRLQTEAPTAPNSSTSSYMWGRSVMCWHLQSGDSSTRSCMCFGTLSNRKPCEEDAQTGTGLNHGQTEAGHAPIGDWCLVARGDAAAKLMIGIFGHLYAF